MVVTPGPILRDRLMVVQKTRQPDGMGGMTETETQTGPVRGRVVALDYVVDDTVAGRLGGRPPYRIVLDARQVPQVRTGDVLVGADGRRYTVVRPSRQGRVWLLMATEEVA